MTIKSRIERLEGARGAWDLTLLTDAELIALEAGWSKAAATGQPVTDYITPELEAALRRARR